MMSIPWPDIIMKRPVIKAYQISRETLSRSRKSLKKE